jgi:phosphoribosyl-ATP pyrophosphohydrolase/phosphoribosyl-AMP cyclohydrolase/histidinol dehydrogenase
MMKHALRRIRPQDLPSIRRDATDADTLHKTQAIVDAVRDGGWDAAVELATRFGEAQEGRPWIYDRTALQAALNTISPADRAVLERTGARIRAFADAQRASVQDITIPIPGGVAGHTVAPVEIAGCYAPGGRFPLPSSVLMTAITARAAGCTTVWVASPRPTTVTLAAAAIAGADALLAIGGAQAIAAMAWGAGEVPACDVIVGPGNRWVTAAKQLVAGRVRIDMLAGPSELVVLADAHADPATVAADLLAQAEHDPDALPILVTPSLELADAVDAELDRQLPLLKTFETASQAVAGGFTVLVSDLEEGMRVCDQLAPEHLEVLTEDAAVRAPRLSHYGGLFVGHGAAEVLGDYGAGPNHTLPTGGTARSFAGLSVFNFLRVRTWMRVDELEAAQPLVEDAVAMAGFEGLDAHGRSAARRLKDGTR